MCIPLKFVVLVALVFFGCSGERDPQSRPTLPASKVPTAEVRGTVTECFGPGVIVPLKNLPVYAYTMEESIEMRKTLAELEKQGPADTPERIEESFRRAELLFQQVRNSLPSMAPVKTDGGGFCFKNLEPGSKYLILAISLNDEEPLPFFRQVITPLLKPGNQELPALGPRSQSDCQPRQE